MPDQTVQGVEIPLIHPAIAIQVGARRWAREVLKVLCSEVQDVNQKCLINGIEYPVDAKIALMRAVTRRPDGPLG